MTDDPNMPDTGRAPYTHTAYFFIRTGMRKGKIYGYWKDGGGFMATENGNYFARSDMLPRPGWDGRIKFVKFGDPRPEREPKMTPQRPSQPDAGDDHEGDGDGDENHEA
jgi:hypothetical protein